MSFVAIALLSLLVFAFHTVFQKLVLKYVVNDTIVFSFYYYIFALLFLAPLFFFNQISVPTSGQWVGIAGTGLLRTVMMILWMNSLKKLDVSVVSPMFNLRVIFVAILEIIFLATVFTSSQFLWIIVLIIGGIFLSMDEKFNWRSFFSPSMLTLILVLIMSAGQSILINKTLAITDFWTFNFWGYVFSLFGLVPILWWQKSQLRLPFKSILTLAGTASLYMVGILLENHSISLNPTGTAAILALPGGMLIAIILSKFNPELLEKHSWKVYALRLLSAAVMTVAVWQIVR